MNNVITVNFHQDTLYAVEVDGDVFVALKPICEALGVQWHGQRERIRRDAILNEGARIIRAPSAGGDQETFFLRLGLLNGWLFGIDASRVKVESRDRVLTYKRECYDALFAHFYRKTASTPTEAGGADAFDFAAAFDTAEDDDEGEVMMALPSDDAALLVRRSLVSEARKTHGVAAARELWLSLGLPATPAMRMGALPAGSVHPSGRQKELVSRFLRACTTCSGSRHAGVRSGDLYGVFEAWSAANGAVACSPKLFGEAMKHLGWISKKRSVIYWPGLALTKSRMDFARGDAGKEAAA